MGEFLHLTFFASFHIQTIIYFELYKACNTSLLFTYHLIYLFRLSFAMFSLGPKLGGRTESKKAG